MMSTPTNKLATYFGDDKPTSRSKVKCKLSDNPLEIKCKLSLLSVEQLSVGRWIGIGFACVKHCARGFTAASSRARGFKPRDGRTGEIVWKDWKDW